MAELRATASETRSTKGSRSGSVAAAIERMCQQKHAHVAAHLIHSGTSGHTGEREVAALLAAMLAGKLPSRRVMIIVFVLSRFREDENGRQEAQCTWAWVGGRPLFA